MSNSILPFLFSIQRRNTVGYNSPPHSGKEKGEKKENEAVWLLFSERKRKMKIERNEKIFSTSISSRNGEYGWEWVGKIEEKEIVGKTLEECFEKVIEESGAKEFELIPQKISYNEIGSYLLILKKER